MPLVVRREPAPAIRAAVLIRRPGVVDLPGSQRSAGERVSSDHAPEHAAASLAISPALHGAGRCLGHLMTVGVVRKALRYALVACAFSLGDPQ